MEIITLDPSEIAADRTELVITDFVKVDGAEWGDSEVAGYMSESRIGSSPVDYRIPNRTVTIPLVLRAVGATSFTTIRQQIQAKVALFQREGGWLKREFDDGTKLYLDVVNASLKFSGHWFQAEKDFDVEAQLTLETVPDWYGDEVGPVLLTDDFSTNTIANYTFDQGSGTVSVSGGQLVPSSTAVKRFYHNGYGDESDVEVTIKHTTGSTVAAYEFGLSARRLGGSNYLFGYVTSTTLYIIKRDGAVNTTLVSTAISSLATSTDYWLRFRSEGDKLIAEHWTTDPAAGGSPANILTHTLTGADATKFGYGITGDVGIDWAPGQVAARIDDFSIESRVYRERTNAELIFTPPPSEGDHPGRLRLVVDEDDGETQRGLIWGVRSRHYDSASTAALAYEAEALTLLGSSSLFTWSTTYGVASGAGTNNTVLFTAPDDWAPMLSTEISGVGHMTHTGTYRVFARGAHGSSVSLRLVWDVGDLTLPEENPTWSSTAEPAGFRRIDLGEIRLDPAPNGTHRWQGVIQAKGGIVRLDKLWFVPVDEGMGVLKAPINSDPALGSSAIRDDFNQSAGSLSGKTIQSGGTWSGAGDAVDFTLDTTNDYLQRTEVSDAADTGRYAIAGTTNFTDVLAQVDVAQVTLNALLEDPQGGVFVRYTDTNNWVHAVLGNDANAVPANSLTLQVRKRVAGTITTLAHDQRVGLVSAATFYTVRLMIDAAGNYLAWAGPKGGALELLYASQDVDLATGGALATGEVGVYDECNTAGALTRRYDGFAASAPSTDAVIFPNQSAELRWDGMYREDSTGTSYAPQSWVEGDLPRNPVAGLEGRTTQFFIKASRSEFDVLPDSNLDDISARLSYRPSWLFVTGT